MSEGRRSDDAVAPTGAAEADARTQDEADTRAAAKSSLGALVRDHPWITTIMLVCSIGGAAAGPFLLDEAWPLARQIAAGAFLGAWIGITITFTKMIG